jgi:hypothetical protein
VALTCTKFGAATSGTPAVCSGGGGATDCRVRAANLISDHSLRGEHLGRAHEVVGEPKVTLSALDHMSDGVGAEKFQSASEEARSEGIAGTNAR